MHELLTWTLAFFSSTRNSRQSLRRFLYFKCFGPYDEGINNSELLTVQFTEPSLCIMPRSQVLNYKPV